MPSAPRHRPTLAIVGAGPSALYLLQNLLTQRATNLLGSITVFEARERYGVGMPYSRATTDRYNLCNISSAELPTLPQTLVEWLASRSDEALREYGLARDAIDPETVYARIVLGDYFEAQFETVVEQLAQAGVAVHGRPRTEVADIRDDVNANEVVVVTGEGDMVFDRVVIATGHRFDASDQPRHGYFASPWPIQALLSAPDTFHDFAVGTLGASLSAFDVVTSLAHRHGTFETVGSDGALRYLPDPGCPNFSLTMHDCHGWLPHLQYAQGEPMREVYRHVTREGILALRDEAGILRLEAYFDRACRPVLVDALRHDGLAALADRLAGGMSLEAFIEASEDDHTYDDPFEGMRSELPEARRSLHRDRPIRWKEVLDDLMYTLNFHAELLRAEDRERWADVVMPLLLNVVAALPLRSARILLALRDAGRLELVPGKAEIEEIGPGGTRVSVDDRHCATYRLFVDCGGQPPVSVDEYPFRSLVESGTVRVARAASADGRGTQRLAGLDIDASYRVIGSDAEPNPRIHDIAFPHALGLRPYSYGLQACNHTAGMVVAAWLAMQAGTTAEATSLHAAVPTG